MFFLFACVLPDADSTPKTQEDGGELRIEATEIASVSRVSWTSPVAGTGWLTYQEEGADPREIAAVDSEDGLAHTVLLAGLGADTSWTVRAGTTTEAGDLEAGNATIDVPAAPDRLTGATVTDDTPERGGFTLVTVPSPNDNYIAILDRAGRPTWWLHDESSGTVLDAHYAPSTGTIDYLVSGTEAHFKQVDLEGNLLQDVTGVDAHHGYSALPDGGWLAMVHDTRVIDGVAVVGDQVVVLDADFNVARVVWDAFEQLPAPLPPPDTAETFDWTHGNDVHYVPETGKILLSLYELSAILQIDYATGETDWQLGGIGADRTMDAADVFNHQHGVRPFEGGIIVFNNGLIPNGDIVEAESAVVTYQFDGDHAVQTRRWAEEDGIYVSTLGSAEPDGAGIVSVGWGIAGRLTELDASEPDAFSKLYQLDMPLGSPFGYTHRITDLAGATR